MLFPSKFFIPFWIDINGIDYLFLDESSINVSGWIKNTCDPLWLMENFPEGTAGGLFYEFKT